MERSLALMGDDEAQEQIKAPLYHSSHPFFQIVFDLLHFISFFGSFSSSANVPFFLFIFF